MNRASGIDRAPLEIREELRALQKEEKYQEMALLYVRTLDNVSYQELMYLFEDSFEVPGDYVRVSEKDPNIIFWAGVSAQFLEVTSALCDAPGLESHPTTTLVYMVDGGMLNFPIVQKPPAKGYKKPHWLPVVFRKVPPK